MSTAIRWLGWSLVAIACSACQNKKDAQPSEALGPSPNASILPAPLASASELTARHHDGGAEPADSAARPPLPEAGPPEEPDTLREDTPLLRDTLVSKDNTGLTLEAEWRWPDVQPAPGPDANPDAYKDAREKSLFKSKIDFAPAGRMRLVLTSGSFPLPSNTELRSKQDSLGHILVWPDGGKYRVLPPGSLRAMFGERRADVTPLVAPTVRVGDKGNLHGFVTQKRRFVTPTGELLLEKAGNVTSSGSSGDLLCRLLIELIAAAPDVPGCADGALPLRAEFKWPGGGGLTFEVTAVTKRQDLATGDVYFPPAAASFSSELPPQASGVFLSQAELAELRRRDAPAKESGASGAPGEGLLLVNRTDSLRYAVLDGVAIAWVRPRREQYVIGPRPGRYTLAFRDFFGQSSVPGKAVALPARVVLGDEGDGGTASD